MDGNCMDHSSASSSDHKQNGSAKGPEVLDEPKVNPFHITKEIPWYRIVQICVMSVTIVPIRLVATLVVFVLISILVKIVTWGLPKHQTVPLSAWRRSANGLVKFLLYALYFCMGFHRIKIKGKIAPASEASIVAMAPHTNFLDVIGGIAYGMHSSVGRIESADTPVVGGVFKFCQVIYVDRKDPDSRMKSIKTIKERAQSRGRWPRVTVFCEGTCTNGTGLIRYKLGAFIPGEPVQPLCIQYNNNWDTYSWIPGGFGPAMLIWLILCQFDNSMTLTYLPVHAPSEEEKKNPSLFAMNVRAAMAKELGVEVTDHSYEDYRLMLTAEKLHLPAATGIVEYYKLNQITGLDVVAVEKLLRRFAASASRDGVMTNQLFSHYLHVPLTSAVNSLFELYDVKSRGRINFREFVLGFSFTLKNYGSDELVKQVFQAVMDGSDAVKKESVMNVLETSLSCSADQANVVFDLINPRTPDSVTSDELQEFASSHPEYIYLMSYFSQSKEAKNEDNVNKNEPQTLRNRKL